MMLNVHPLLFNASSDCGAAATSLYAGHHGPGRVPQQLASQLLLRLVPHPLLWRSQVGYHDWQNTDVAMMSLLLRARAHRLLFYCSTATGYTLLHRAGPQESQDFEA